MGRIALTNEQIAEQNTIGSTFGYLKTTSQPFLKQGKYSNVLWINAICECGVSKEYRVASLKTGHTKSCGCYRRRQSKDKNTIHGLYKHPLYKIWEGIKRRCYNEKMSNYKNYGGRGISVCVEWKENPKAFIDWAMANGYQKGLQIDRKENEDGYSPTNCRWVTNKVNMQNKRTNKLVLHQALTIRNLFNIRAFTQKELAGIYNVSYSTVNQIITNQRWVM